MAKLILQNLISAEKVADYFQLRSPLRETFLEEVASYLREGSIDSSSFNLNVITLADTLRNIRDTPVDNRSSLKVSDFLSSSTRSSNSNVGNVVSIDPIITPSILLAASIIDAVHNRKNILNVNTAAELSNSFLSKAYLGSKTLFMANTAIGIGLSIGLGVDGIVTLIKEIQFNRNNKDIEKKLKLARHQAEDACLNLHQMYTTLSQHYQAARQEAQQQYPEDYEKYKEIMEEWASAERYVNQLIKNEQRNLAMLGAMSQELKSKRRIGRANDFVNAALTATAFSGPPGLIASGILKAISCVGMSIAESSIASTAKLNHGVTQDNHVLLVTDSDSVNAAKDLLPHTVSPVLAIGGPELKPAISATLLKLKMKVNFSSDAIFRNEAGLINLMIAKAKDRTSCSFCFLEPLPTLPDITTASEGKNFSNDATLKEKNKQELEQLCQAEHMLNEQANYISLLASRLLKEYQPNHPDVINFNELIEAIETSHHAIQERRQVIKQNMGEDYLKNGKKGMVLMSQLLASEANLDSKLSTLRDQKKILDQSPHAILSRHTLDKNVRDQQIIDTYSQNPDARKTWLTDIQFNLDAINKISKRCQDLGKGRHIANLVEALNEIESQIILLRKIQNNPASKAISEQEKLQVMQYQTQLDQLFQRSLDLDRRRIAFLSQSKTTGLTTQETYQEMRKLEDNLNQYSDHLTTEEGNGTDQSKTTFQLIEQAKEGLAARLEAALEQPTPIRLDKLDITDRMVIPDRTFFGATKHSDMLKDVNDKVIELKQRVSVTKVIQIMPCRAIDEDVLAACQGDYALLAAAIEGIKTEMQWVEKFKTACDAQQIQIANFDDLTQYYLHQTNMLEQICEHKSEALGNSTEGSKNYITAAMTKLDQLSNYLQETFIHRSEKELNKSKQVLEKLQPTTAVLQVPEVQSEKTAVDFRKELAQGRANEAKRNPQAKDPALDDSCDFEL
ncbi:MAG: hypothetical protein NTW08_03395 [Gammaproteobacteria bacterium]|nr:hypothetical protein [Gammaproteobacteria bacterium]